MDLVQAIKAIKSQIDQLEAKRKQEVKAINNYYHREIVDLERALRVNREMNTFCERCEGTGLVRVSHDADKRCSACEGSGKVNKGGE